MIFITNAHYAHHFAHLGFQIVHLHGRLWAVFNLRSGKH